MATAASVPRGTGCVTLEEIATSTGQPPREVVKTLAELSGRGAVRLTFGSSRPIPGMRVRGQLAIADGEDRYVALFADPPWEPLPEDRQRFLDVFLADPGAMLTLGAVILICAAARIGSPSEEGGDLSFTSDEIEDYLGLRRGCMR